MGDFVAVNDSLMLFDMESLKREALMFDRIAVPFGKMMADISNQEYSSEIEWLMDKGIIFEPEINFEDEILMASDEFKSYTTLVSKYILPPNESEKIGRDDLSQVGKERKEPKPSFKEQKLLQGQLICGLTARYLSAQLRVMNNMDSYPVLSPLISSIKESSSKKDSVVQIVLNTLPVPDDSTPWEQIIEYRSDENSYHKFLDLRNWMSEVARSEMLPIEVEQKLEYLISQYQRHMNLHKMKTKPGVLQTIIVAPAEFVENLVKLNWGKIAKNLFNLKQRRIALLEGELNVPGSEVAYIINTREAFPEQR